MTNFEIKTMAKNQFEHIHDVLIGMCLAFAKSPFIIKIATIVGAFFFSLWCDLYIFLIATFIFVGLDTHTAIKACIKEGGKYESHKIKKGLFEKLKLYMMFAILSITLDVIFKQFYNYEKHYFTYTIFAFVVLYEAGSIVESLNVLYPNNKTVKKISSILNLAEKKIDDKIGIEKEGD